MIESMTSIIVGVIIAYLVYYVCNFYLKVMSYPKGPFPLPLLGNIYLFRSTKSHPMKTLITLSKKYGPIYTFWLGSEPYVFIFDLNLAKEAFSKSVFSGRPQNKAVKLLCNENGGNILLADYSPQWESLRRVSHTVLRNYANSDKLAKLAVEVIDETMRDIIAEQGIGKPFNAAIYLQLAVYNFIAISGFGKRYTLKDPEFQTIHKINGTFFELGYKLALIKFVPILKPLLFAYLAKYEWTNNEYIKSSALIMDKYKRHIDSFDGGLVRDFADALISAKNEAIAKEKESASYLNDYSLSLALWDLFVAGSDTISFAFQWIVLLMANHEEMQQRMRHEIQTQIGDRRPTQADKNRCHYTMAFVSEALRFRAVSPLGATHKTMADIRIANATLPANTNVVVHLFSVCTDEKYWPDGHMFNPDRFLANGQYVGSRPPAFVPFGIGRRMCIGDKLALAELFVVLARLLQTTKGYSVALPDGDRSADLEPDANAVMLFSVPICVPKSYQILLKKVN